jgi:arylsulfatase A-like enzyme
VNEFILRTSGPAGADRAYGAWIEPALRRRGSGPADRGPVILVSCDALRADRLGSYGNKRGLTPHLDGLARDRTTVFTHAVSASSWTLPSHLSMFTGVYPTLFGNMRNLDRNVPTLGEVFRGMGYLCHAITGIPWLRPQHGFGRGFHFYKYEPKDRGRPMGEVVDEALAWIQESRDLPFLLFLHACSPHEPYLLSQDCVPRIVKPDPSGPLPDYADLAPAAALEREGKIPPEAERRRIEDYYDCNVFQMDQALGRLIQGLKDTGLYDSCVLVLTSDHGQEFWEHGAHGHGKAFYGETLSVPLLVRARGTGGRDARLASHIDIFPTLVAAAGGAPPRPVQGRNLAEKWDRDAVFSQDPAGFHSAVTTRKARLIRRNKFPDKLFDLRADPGEKKNLAGRGGPLEAGADSLLSAFIAESYPSWHMTLVPGPAKEKVRVQVATDGGLSFQRGAPFFPSVFEERSGSAWSFSVEGAFPTTYLIPTVPADATLRVSAWTRGEDGEPRPFPVYAGESEIPAERLPVLLGPAQPGYPGQARIPPGIGEKPGVRVWRLVSAPVSAPESPMTEEEVRALRSLGYLQ